MYRRNGCRVSNFETRQDGVMSAIIPLTKLYFALRPPRGPELHTSVGYSTRGLYTKVAMEFPRVFHKHIHMRLFHCAQDCETLQERQEHYERCKRCKRCSIVLLYYCGIAVGRSRYERRSPATYVRRSRSFNPELQSLSELEWTTCTACDALYIYVCHQEYASSDTCRIHVAGTAGRRSEQAVRRARLLGIGHARR